MAGNSFWGELRDLFSPLLVPLRALLVSLSGALLAWAWYHGETTLPVILGLIAILFAYVLDWIGRSILHKDPVLGLAFMEVWLLSPLVLAVFGSAAVVIVSVEFAAPEGSSPQNREFLGALGTALTAFFTASFVSWVGDSDGSPVAARIQRAFVAKYKRGSPTGNSATNVTYVQAETPKERWVYSNEYEGISGWGLSARWKRAEELAKIK